MRFAHYWSDPDRWNWFAAGDETVAPPAQSTASDTSPRRLLFEVALVLAVPLAAAALFTILFGG